MINSEWAFGLVVREPSGITPTPTKHLLQLQAFPAPADPRVCRPQEPGAQGHVLGLQPASQRDKAIGFPALSFPLATSHCKCMTIRSQNRGSLLL